MGYGGGAESAPPPPHNVVKTTVPGGVIQKSVGTDYGNVFVEYMIQN